METFRKTVPQQRSPDKPFSIKNFPSRAMQSVALKQMFANIYAAFIQDK